MRLVTWFKNRSACAGIARMHAYSVSISFVTTRHDCSGARERRQTRDGVEGGANASVACTATTNVGRRCEPRASSGSMPVAVSNDSPTSAKACSGE